MLAARTLTRAARPLARPLAAGPVARPTSRAMQIKRRARRARPTSARAPPLFSFARLPTPRPLPHPLAPSSPSPDARRSGEGAKGFFHQFYVVVGKSTPVYFGYLIGMTILLEVRGASCHRSRRAHGGGRAGSTGRGDGAGRG